MTKYDQNPGFTSSETERAIFASHSDLRESKLERVTKRKLTKGLTRLAVVPDPPDVTHVQVRNLQEPCC